jgi:hypothetical protein
MFNRQEINSLRSNHDKAGASVADWERRANLAVEFWDNPRTQAAIERFLHLFPGKENAISVLVIGGKSNAQLLNELKAMGGVGAEAENMMNGAEFTTTPNMEPVLLVKLSLREIGLDIPLFHPFEGPLLPKIKELAQQRGLEFCPAEVAPHLRLAYSNQKIWEELRVGMTPIAESADCRNLFRLENSGGRWLYSDYEERLQAPQWRSDDEWVFRLRV